MTTPQTHRLQQYGHDALVGLSVSIVTLSLGAAFGQLSGRGVLIGMLSAAVIPIITSLLGGTRVQCSGPTGPMTATFVAIVATTMETVAGGDSQLAQGFMHLILLLTGALLLAGAFLRIGNWISIVPTIAVSGFMNGIALIIWLSQGAKLLQLDADGIDGPVSLNVLIALLTAGIAIALTRLGRRLPPRASGMLPGTLLALIAMTLVVHVLRLPVGFATAGISLHSLHDLGDLFARNAPTGWPWHLWLAALPFALQLASVAYVDTLLTSLIVDRMRGERTARNRELSAQGIAMAAVTLFGGIPGAQATERSVLMTREGARTRFAGVSAGLISLVAVLLFQDAISLIPKAVLAGVLLKIGYDVFDWLPLRLWIRRQLRGTHTASTRVSTLEVGIILATAAITALVDVTLAVIGCTAVFYALRRIPSLRPRLHDLVPVKESEGVLDEA